MIQHVNVKYEVHTKTTDLPGIYSLNLKVFVPYNLNSQ